MRERSERENLIRQASKPGVSVAEVAARLGIPASTAYRCSRQAIDILELPLPSPPPTGTEWIEAYRHWRKGW